MLRRRSRVREGEKVQEERRVLLLWLPLRNWVRRQQREEVEEMRLGVEARRLGLLMELGFVTCCLDLLLLFPSLGRERGN